MLHLVNGQCTLDTLSKTRIAGEKDSIDDILMEGPLPGGLQRETDWWQRAAWLEKRFCIPVKEYLDNAKARDNILTRSDRENEVVLWYENDVFCQLNYLYVLSRLFQSDFSCVRLCEVCPEEGQLGLLNEKQLEVLFEQRAEVTNVRLALSANIWNTICDGNFVSLWNHDFSAWPRLKSGLELYLDYQSNQIRLHTVVEEAIANGKSTFADILAEISSSPGTKDYGLGDLQLARLLLDWRGKDIEIEGELQFTSHIQLMKNARGWKLRCKRHKAHHAD